MEFFIEKTMEDTKKLLNNLLYLIKNDAIYIKILSIFLAVCVLLLYASFIAFASLIAWLFALLKILIYICIYVVIAIACEIVYQYERWRNIWQMIREKDK